MAHKFCFEALNKSLRDIIAGENRLDSIFGGKVIVFEGDFRRILPVIPWGSHSDIVQAIINASYLWDHCQVLSLNRNMCLQTGVESTNTSKLRDFSELILKIGDGKSFKPNDDFVEIDILKDLLITEFDDPIDAIV